MEVSGVEPLAEVGLDQQARFLTGSTGGESSAWPSAASDGARGKVSGVVLLLLLRSGRKPSKAPLQGRGARLPGQGVGAFRPRFRPYFLCGNDGYT